MEERVKKTFSLSRETADWIEETAASTHRADSHVIDWLVAEAKARIAEINRAQTTIEQAMVAPTE